MQLRKWSDLTPPSKILEVHASFEEEEEAEVEEGPVIAEENEDIPSR